MINRASSNPQTPTFGTHVDLARTFRTDPAEADGMQTLPEQLSARIMALIINGEFEPGQRLQESALAERFEVSRGPIREALRILEREGLVTMASRRGASVTRLTAERLRDIFNVRAALMGICAEELAERRDPEVQSIMDEGTRRLLAANEAGDEEEFIAIVYQLSMYISEAAGNEIARSILFSLGRQTLPLTRRLFQDEAERLTWAGNWQAISEAIRAGDPVRARQAVRKLLADIRTGVLAVQERLEEERRSAGS
ncbi:GntR family transcriptional regulator [Paracoccus sp. SSJ]|uniref:GntR family transcriptional regulator n=1 Tax=Paracoccus sp. SSJ TaxID=3050636 RepID=UPI00254E0EC8|nr:GntR family transcriptional regulator [Paracoccus sp. SSJ]MDK8873806.1 GntR family transcriptional regulator [Paracoccus sp. SSJ]